jgi:hypothetical protein
VAHHSIDSKSETMPPLFDKSERVIPHKFEQRYAVYRSKQRIPRPDLSKHGELKAIEGKERVSRQIPHPEEPRSQRHDGRHGPQEHMSKLVSVDPENEPHNRQVEQGDSLGVEANGEQEAGSHGRRSASPLLNHPQHKQRSEEAEQELTEENRAIEAEPRIAQNHCP